MIKLDDIHIISIIETGTGFGVHAETGENVFIPASVVNGARLQIGEQVGAVLVPNMAEMRDKTPWRAVRVPREGVAAFDPILSQTNRRSSWTQASGKAF
jgi:hypothetical protein